MVGPVQLDSGLLVSIRSSKHELDHNTATEFDMPSGWLGALAFDANSEEALGSVTYESSDSHGVSVVLGMDQNDEVILAAELFQIHQQPIHV